MYKPFYIQLKKKKESNGKKQRLAKMLRTEVFHLQPRTSGHIKYRKLGEACDEFGVPLDFEN